MATIPRGADDIILDNMVTALQEFESEQVAEAEPEENVSFRVVRDLVRPPARLQTPLVNIWLESLDPQAGGSSARIVTQFLARYNVDCYTQGIVDEDTGDEATAAMARLYYLKEQVKEGLYRLVSTNYGLQAGTIGRKSWPRWSLFQNGFKLPEDAVVAGRWAVEIEYSWKPEDIASVALEQIAVNAVRWSALYTYEEG